MREKLYKVTLLVKVECQVKALDEIGAETEAIKNHPHLAVHKVRVRRKGLDTGFYLVEGAK